MSEDPEADLRSRRRWLATMRQALTDYSSAETTKRAALSKQESALRTLRAVLEPDEMDVLLRMAMETPNLAHRRLAHLLGVDEE